MKSFFRGVAGIHVTVNQTTHRLRVVQRQFQKVNPPSLQLGDPGCQNKSHRTSWMRWRKEEDLDQVEERVPDTVLDSGRGSTPPSFDNHRYRPRPAAGGAGCHTVGV